MSVAIVILAAGEASRFGGPKQLSDWFGQSLLSYVANKLLRLNEPLYICLGAHREKIEAELNLQSANIIHVDHWYLGPGASIKSSLEALYRFHCKGISQLKGVLFVAADQPLLECVHYQKLLDEALKSQYGKIIATHYKEVCSSECQEIGAGVPAFFPRDYFQELSQISDGKGAKSVIAKHDSVAIEAMGDLMDIDTQDDLDKAKAIAVMRKNKMQELSKGA